MVKTSCFFKDKVTHGQAAEDCVIRGEIQKSQRDLEKVSTRHKQKR